VHIISRKKFIEACNKFSNHCSSIDMTYHALNKNDFKNSKEMKKIFKSLDNFKYKKNWWVIDIAGNNLRLIAYINFEIKKIFVKHIVKHSEYDKLTDYYRSHKK